MTRTARVFTCLFVIAFSTVCAEWLTMLSPCSSLPAKAISLNGNCVRKTATAHSKIICQNNLAVQFNCAPGCDPDSCEVIADAVPLGKCVYDWSSGRPVEKLYLCSKNEPDYSKLLQSPQYAIQQTFYDRDNSSLISTETLPSNVGCRGDRTISYCTPNLIVVETYSGDKCTGQVDTDYESRNRWDGDSIWTCRNATKSM